MNRTHAEDVAAASAAYLYNLLPDILALPAPQCYQRLSEFILTAILAYCECQYGWAIPPLPSDN